MSVLNGQADSNYVTNRSETSTNLEIAAVNSSNSTSSPSGNSSLYSTIKGKVTLERGIGDYEESRLVVKQELYPSAQPHSFQNQYYGTSNTTSAASTMGVYPPPPLELKFASDSSHPAYQINYGHSKSYISHV